MSCALASRRPRHTGWAPAPGRTHGMADCNASLKTGQRKPCTPPLRYFWQPRHTASAHGEPSIWAAGAVVTVVHRELRGSGRGDGNTSRASTRVNTRVGRAPGKFDPSCAIGQVGRASWEATPISVAEVHASGSGPGRGSRRFGGNTGSEESTSGGVADNAQAARRRDNNEDIDGIHVGHGRTPAGPVARLRWNKRAYTGSREQEST
jgi:hypothetical protein